MADGSNRVPLIEWNVADWETLCYALDASVKPGELVTVCLNGRAVKLQVVDVITISRPSQAGRA